MPTYTYDHIHLRSHDPMETARYFNEMFDAKIIEAVQSDGQPRVDVDVNGLMIYLARADAGDPLGPTAPHLGLDHFGFRVDDLDEAVTELKKRGAEFSTEPPCRPARPQNCLRPRTGRCSHRALRVELSTVAECPEISRRASVVQYSTEEPPR